jgi:methionine-gamma-lyase
MSKNYKHTHIKSRELHPETQMLSYGYDAFLSEGAVKPPVFLTSTFAYKTAEDGEEFFNIMSGRKPMPEGSVGGLIYSRFNNPNLEIVEDRLALLEGAEACNIFSSGMSAIGTMFFALLKPNDVVVHSAPLYGGTETLIRKSFKNWGVDDQEFLDGLDQQNIEEALELGRAKGRVAMVYLESPANPTNSMVDFGKVKNAVDNFEKAHGYRPIIACDNTMFGPIFQKPLQHGVDLVCYSLTKYVGGHSDLVAGAVMGRKELMDKIRSNRNSFGSQLDPHSAWMILRSLETLYVRMERAEQSALIIADWLANNPYKKLKIYHPKYVEDENYQIAFKSQCLGFGSTFAFVIEGATKQDCFKFIDTLKLFKSAVSLGGTESLICHPSSTTHSGVPQNLRKIFGIEEGLIRISVGLAHPQDLIADLEEGFLAIS